MWGPLSASQNLTNQINSLILRLYGVGAYRSCRSLPCSSREPSVRKRRGHLHYVLNSAPFLGLSYLRAVYISLSHWIIGPTCQSSLNRLHFSFLFHFLFPLPLTHRSHLSASLFVIPRMHPAWSWTLAKCPQLCVLHYTSRTCFIFKKLYVLRFSVYFISKFMVFNIEFNHEFYYVESPFYFWDF